MAKDRLASGVRRKAGLVYKVGDSIQVSLNNRIVVAVIRAVIEKTDGLHYQVDFGNEQTALVRASQVVSN